VIRGRIFCHVRSRVVGSQLILLRVGGNQKWKGTIPVLILMAIRKRGELSGCICGWRLNIVAVRKSKEPVAWAVKYFVLVWAV